MTQQPSSATVILLPKIKKVQLRQKILLDPADFRKGIPKNKLPEFNEKGLILSLIPQKVPLARMNDQGTLKMIITYSAQILLLIGRYIEAKVIDDYGDVWIGMALGVTVYGKGGSGSLRACKVLSLEGQRIKVQAIQSQPGNISWQNLLKKVQTILKQNK